MTGEVAGYVMGRLMEKGALDVFYTPIYMKKNRPAMTLSVLCREEEISRMQKEIFRETTTIGIRMYKASRACMDREWLTAHTKYGDILVKRASYEGIIKSMPEYEDCKKRAEEYQVPVLRVYQEALSHILEES